MSSSTSRFDPIPRVETSLKAWSWAVAISSVILFGIVSVVGAVDPFDSGVFPARFSIDRVNTYRQQNVALWAALDIARDPVSARQQASIVVLGDSRGEQMRGGFNAPRTFTILGRNVYDLSFGGASIYEMLEFFRHYRKDFAALKTVVVVLPLSKLVARGTIHDRSKEALVAADNRISYLLDHTMINRSAEWLISGARTPDYRPPLRRARADSASDLSAPLCIVTAETAKLTENFLQVEIRQLRNATKQWSEVMAHAVGPFLSELRASGIEPIILLPPLSPPVRAFIADTMPNDIVAYEKSLNASVRVYKVPSSFENATGWSDAVHLCNESALQILPMVIKS